MKALLGGIAAATLAAQPVAAAAVSRDAPSTEGASALGGDGDGGLIGILVFAAIVAAFYFIAQSDNDEPVSA